LSVPHSLWSGQRRPPADPPAWQQAEAIVAARGTMVAGAVGLVEMALQRLNESDSVELDPERRAAMAANLMVVLSGDHSPSPVINTGSLYT
jgi:hypothetical protein